MQVLLKCRKLLDDFGEILEKCIKAPSEASAASSIAASTASCTNLPFPNI